MKRKNKILLFLLYLIPVLYIIFPVFNSTGCEYTSQIETDDVVTYGVCHRGILRTLTHFKKTGLTISETMVTAYRKPFLRTISINKEVLSPPLVSATLSSLSILSAEYLNPVVKTYHVERLRGYYIYMLESDRLNVDDNHSAYIYKVAVNGNMSYWD